MKQLTSTSRPFGHRLSGDLTGFGALASEGRCVTGIKRADTASVNSLSRTAASNPWTLPDAVGLFHFPVRGAIQHVTRTVLIEFRRHCKNLALRNSMPHSRLKARPGAPFLQSKRSTSAVRLQSECSQFAPVLHDIRDCQIFLRQGPA